MVYIRAFAFALLFLLLQAPLSGTYAQGGEHATGTAPAPLGGAGSVVFVSQAVDATLYRSEQGQYLVDARGNIRLHNTNRFSAASVTLGWPGWPGGDLYFDAAQLGGFVPASSQGRLGTSLRTLATTWNDEQRESSWLVAQVGIGRDARERISINWTQTLGDGPLLTYSFGAIPASAWAGTVGSLRVTLELPAYAASEILVRVEPADYTFDGSTLEWLLVEQEPTVNPTVTLIAPHLWAEIEAARAARAADPLNASLRLAELYEVLVGAGLTHYGAEAEAMLEVARQSAPDNPEPLRRLAALYRARAAQGEESDRLAMLEQAVLAAEGAIRAGDTDPASRDALIQDLETLANAWAETDPAVALEFLVRAEQAGGDAERLAPRRRAIAEQLALQALQERDWTRALTLADSYGLPTDVATLPWLESVHVQIENGPEARLLQLYATGDGGVLEERLGGLAERLTASGYPAQWDGSVFSIALRGDETERANAGRAVAAALAPEPEWDLLRDALAPSLLQYRTAQNTFESQYAYREQLRVETRAAQLAEQLRQAAPQRGSAWEEALMTEAARRWQALYDSQSVQVTTRFEVGQSVQRSWTLSLPADETLEWEGEAARRDRWVLAMVGGSVLLLLVLALIWLPGRRSSQQSAVSGQRFRR